MSVLSVVGQRARVLQWRSLSVDLDGRTLRVAGLDVSVTEAEFDLVCCLLRHRGIPLSKETILVELFGPDHGRSSLQVDVFVTRLRRSLAPVGLDDFVVTVATRGYVVGDEAGPSASPYRGLRMDDVMVAA